MTDELASERARQFVAGHGRSILTTHRRDGGLQASPIRVMLDDGSRIVVSTRATTAKVGNLQRDPRFALCVISDGFGGPWMTIEGRAEMIRLPEALSQLRAFYVKRDGSVPADDEFEASMIEQQRLLLVLSVDRATPTPAER